MPKRSSKLQKDTQELARHVLDTVVPDAEPARTAQLADQETLQDSEEPKSEKNPAAVALGRLGGKKGGPARAAKLTSEQRKEIARKAAQKRWEDRR